MIASVKIIIIILSLVVLSGCASNYPDKASSIVDDPKHKDCFMWPDGKPVIEAASQKQWCGK